MLASSREWWAMKIGWPGHLGRRLPAPRGHTDTPRNSPTNQQLKTKCTHYTLPFYHTCTQVINGTWHEVIRLKQTEKVKKKIIWQKKKKFHVRSIKALCCTQVPNCKWETNAFLCCKGSIELEYPYMCPHKYSLCKLEIWTLEYCYI